MEDAGREHVLRVDDVHAVIKDAAVASSVDLIIGRRSVLAFHSKATKALYGRAAERVNDCVMAVSGVSRMVREATAALSPPPYEDADYETRAEALETELRSATDASKRMVAIRDLDAIRRAAREAGARAEAYRHTRATDIRPGARFISLLENLRSMAKPQSNNKNDGTLAIDTAWLPPDERPGIANTVGRDPLRWYD